MRNKSDSKIRATTIEGIINEIRSKSVDGDYIYRGEREKYETISSALYRAFTAIIKPEEFQSGEFDSRGFDLMRAQEAMLNVAKNHRGESPVGPLEDFIRVANLDREPVGYTEESMGKVFEDQLIKTIGETIAETADQEILTEIQHYGGTTNLIDFTTDYSIALYFACSGDYKETGRVIRLEKNEKIERMLVRPRNPRHRVIAQKSIFLQPPQGYIKVLQNNSEDDIGDTIEVSEDDIIDIPAHLKKPMLDHLRKFYSISTESIYNDIHGFIRYRKIHESAYAQAYLGFLVHDRADKEVSPGEEKRAEYEKAVEYYTEAIHLNPDNPNLGTVYCNRGEARLHLREWEKATEDFAMARDIGKDIVRSFRNDYKGGVKEFEEKTGIEIPPALAGILGDAGYKIEQTSMHVDDISPDEGWTVERFNELLSPQEYRGFYESRNQTEKLCEFGADLMALVENKQWELTPEFKKYYFALYFGRRRVFGVNLSGPPKLAVWLPKDVLAERNNDLFDDQRTYTYHESYKCGIYPEHVTVANIEELLEFAYLWHADLLV